MMGSEEMLDLVKDPGKTPLNIASKRKGDGGLSNCSPLLIGASIAVVFGGAFQLGFSIGNVANTLPLIIDFYSIDNTTSLYPSMFVAGNPVGGLIGALLVGPIADKFGRRWGLIGNALPFIIGCVLMGSAYDKTQLIIGRVVAGIGVGIGSGLTNMFISEVSPVSIRGLLGMSYGLVLTIGILLSYLLSMPQIFTDDKGWRVFFCIPIIPAVIQSMVMFIAPDTPVYLALRYKDLTKAKQALSRYRRDVVEEEVEELIEIQRSAKGRTKRTIWDLLSDPSQRLALVIGTGLHMAQQFSAINAVLSYTPEIFADADVGDPTVATVITGAVNCIVTMIAAPFSDKLGRRFILIGGTTMSGIAYGFLAISQACNESTSCSGSWTSYTAIVSVFLFIAGFASGLGSLPWLMVNELFTTEYRGLANSICCSVNWISSIILLLTYSIVKEALHPFTFFLYMGVVLLFLAFVILFVPETRQKTVQEIKAELTVQAKRFPPLLR